MELESGPRASAGKTCGGGGSVAGGMTLSGRVVSWWEWYTFMNSRYKY